VTRDDRIRCPLCGTRYSPAEARACRTACPLHDGCGLLRCPRCGHEVPAPTRLTRWLSRLLGRSEAGA
jgi:DNA-directed RNA polymerase subunit RPC12/RpoP